jgi:hypothetical protein
VTIVLARDWLGSCCRRGSSGVAEPVPTPLVGPKALPVVADVGENYGGAAEGHRFHGDG